MTEFGGTPGHWLPEMTSLCEAPPQPRAEGPLRATCLPPRFQDPTEWVAYAGTTQLSGSEASTVRARVAQIITHPSYNPDTADFDVAVLRLGSPLPFSRHVQPVCLPAATHVFPPRRKCLISGWGYLKEDFRKLPSPPRLRAPGAAQFPPPRGSLSAESPLARVRLEPRVDSNGNSVLSGGCAQRRRA